MVKSAAIFMYDLRAMGDVQSFETRKAQAFQLFQTGKLSQALHQCKVMCNLGQAPSLSGYLSHTDIANLSNELGHILDRLGDYAGAFEAFNKKVLGVQVPGQRRFDPTVLLLVLQ